MICEEAFNPHNVNYYCQCIYRTIIFMRHKEFGRLAIFALQIEIMFILFISTVTVYFVTHFMHKLYF